jgi:hypothetical protein
MAFGPVSFFVAFVVSLVINVIAYVLMPKPKGPKPDEVKEMDAPVAERGKPVPVVFGTVWIKEANVLWYGDKETNTYEVNA